MLTPEQTEAITTFYQKCKDEVLDPATADPRYVNYLSSQNVDPILALASEITMNPAAGVNLFTGRVGGGKSTELRRLRMLLQKQGCVVFLSDMRSYMHMDSPVGISDFLLSLMTSLNDAYSERYGDDPSHASYIKRFFQFLTETKIEIKEADLKAGVADIKVALSEDPSVKERINSGSEVSKLLRQVHEFTAEIVKKTRDKEGNPDLKVVFLVDQFELRGEGRNGDNLRSVQDLFTTHGDRLRLPMLHTVYTAPLYLFFLVKGLASRFGGDGITNVPCIHVFKERSCELDDSHGGGVTTLMSILAHRYSEWETFFSENQIKRLIQTSGGDIRDFLLLIRSALSKLRAIKEPHLPVPDDVLDLAINALRLEYLPLPEDKKAWLGRIRRTGEAQLASDQQVLDFVAMLDQKLVINYQNGSQWYDIHPVLHGLLPKA